MTTTTSDTFAVPPGADEFAEQVFKAVTDAEPIIPVDRAAVASADHSRAFDRCLKYMAKIDRAIAGDDGHKAFLRASRVCVRFDLSESEHPQALEWFSDNMSDPRWSAREIAHKVSQGRKLFDAERGKLLLNNGTPREPKPATSTSGSNSARAQGAAKRNSRDRVSAEPLAVGSIANVEVIEVEDDNGEKKKVTIPRSMTDIINTINRHMGDWPRRVDKMLFVDDPEHGLDYFDRRTTAGMFGWLRRHNKVSWHKGGSLVSHAELFAEVERTAQRYEAIELLPHEPPIGGVYYRGKTPAPGDGSHLKQLLDRFRPETTIDRHLIQAAFVTPAWGGLPGCRPAFVVTSDDGRGVGKSRIPEAIGYLYGGHIDVSAGEDIEQLKTRMLTPGARTKRIALLDNVKSLRLSWAELEAMITAPIISGRQLYIGEGQRPNLLTWFITLNGVSMATDMAQRSVIIKVVKGKNDGPWWEQTRQFIDQHRKQIIGDIIGMLRADPKPLGEYTRWATWEDHVLRRLPEPGEAQRLILERQGDANCEQDEAEIIEEHFAEQLLKLGYEPTTDQIRIPVSIVARWFGWAVGEQTKTAAASKRLHQMAKEGQIRRITPDSTRTYGRCFIWTGESADVVGQPIVNDLEERIAARHRAAS